MSIIYNRGIQKRIPLKNGLKESFEVKEFNSFNSALTNIAKLNDTDFNEVTISYRADDNNFIEIQKTTDSKYYLTIVKDGKALFKPFRKPFHSLQEVKNKIMSFYKTEGLNMIQNKIPKLNEDIDDADWVRNAAEISYYGSYNPEDWVDKEPKHEIRIKWKATFKRDDGSTYEEERLFEEDDDEDYVRQVFWENSEEGDEIIKLEDLEEVDYEIDEGWAKNFMDKRVPTFIKPSDKKEVKEDCEEDITKSVFEGLDDEDPEIEIEDNFDSESYINSKMNELDTDEERYILIKSKSVEDADGFYTDYTMYKDNVTGNFVFIFGDNEVYTPENESPDYVAETAKEAYDWFNNYEGFAEEMDEAFNEFAELDKKKEALEVDFEDKFEDKLESWDEHRDDDLLDLSDEDANYWSRQRDEDERREREEQEYLQFIKDEEDNQINESWEDIYDQFTSIIDKYFPDNFKINTEISMLYDAHRGEPDWDLAYRKWLEGDEDAEIAADNFEKKYSYPYVNFDESLKEDFEFDSSVRSQIEKAVQKFSDEENVADGSFVLGDYLVEFDLNNIWVADKDKPKDVIDSWFYKLEESYETRTGYNDRRTEDVNPELTLKDIEIELDKEPFESLDEFKNFLADEFNLELRKFIPSTQPEIQPNDLITVAGKRSDLIRFLKEFIGARVKDFEDQLNESLNESPNSVKKEPLRIYDYLGLKKNTIEEFVPGKYDLYFFIEDNDEADYYNTQYFKSFYEFRDKIIDMVRSHPNFSDFCCAEFSKENTRNESLNEEFVDTIRLSFLIDDELSDMEFKFDNDGYELELLDKVADNIMFNNDLYDYPELVKNTVEERYKYYASLKKKDESFIEDPSDSWEEGKEGWEEESIYSKLKKKFGKKNLKEASMSDLDAEIRDSEGINKLIYKTERNVKALEDEIHFLTTQAPREIQRGGAFDSQEEIDEALYETRKTLDKERAKLRVLKGANN